MCKAKKGKKGEEILAVGDRQGKEWIRAGRKCEKNARSESVVEL